MGLAERHALGRNQRFYAVAEAVYGTLVKPTGTDAIKVLTSAFEFDQARKERNDSRQTRDFLERITGRKTVSFSLEAFLNPSGAAGTAPDIGPLLLAIFGTETIVSGTSVTYSLDDAQDVLGSLSLFREFNDTLEEAIVGAWIESMTLNLSGGDEPKVTFEGGGSDHVHTGTGLLTAILNATDPTFTVSSGDAGDVQNYAIGSLVKFVNPTTGAVLDDNSGAGYEVTLVVDSTGVVTITPIAAVGAASGSRVVPFAPTETTAGSPIAGILGSIVLSAVTVPVLAAEITIGNNNKMVDDEYGEDAVTDYIVGTRDVTGTISVRARRDLIKELGRRKRFQTRDVDLVSGSVAGSILTVNLPFVEFNFAAVEVPEAEEGTFALPFRALGSVGADSIDWVFT